MAERTVLWALDHEGAIFTRFILFLDARRRRIPQKNEREAKVRQKKVCFCWRVSFKTHSQFINIARFYVFPNYLRSLRAAYID